MWRDVLLILGFAFAVFAYFGLTPRRISVYARFTRDEIVKRTILQRALLLFMIIVTLFFIFVYIFSFDRFRQLEWQSATMITLFTIGFLLILWATFFEDIWLVSERRKRLLRRLVRFVGMPVFLAAIILNLATETGTPLWQRLCYLVGGYGIGYGARKLVDYLERRRDKKSKAS